MNPSKYCQPDRVLLFPRKSNAVLLRDTITRYVDYGKCIPFLDPRDFFYGRIHSDLKKTLSTTHAKILVVIEAPVISNLQITPDSLIRSVDRWVKANYAVVLIIDTQHAYTKRLLPQMEGNRVDIESSTGIDPDYHNPVGHHQAKVPADCPRDPLTVETTQEKLQRDFDLFMKNVGEWEPSYYHHRPRVRYDLM